MQKRRFSALLAGLFVAAALGLSAPASAEQYKDEYKMSTVLGDAFPWGWGAKRWAELVAEKTGGRINIKVYPGASLVSGDQTKEFTALRQGIIDMAVGSTINWSPQVKELNLFSLPFLMPDHKAIDALTHGRVGKKLFEDLAARDVVPLAWGENGYREVSNSKRPIRTPEDLKGMKMRVVGSPLFLATFSALGANPTQMSWADAQPAMATGAVDGQENPLAVIYHFNLYEVQPYLAMTRHVYNSMVHVINLDAWNQLTPEQQTILREESVRAAGMFREANLAAEADLIDRLQTEGGMEVTYPDPAAFRAVMQPAYDRIAEYLGQDTVDRFLEMVEAERQ